MPRKKPVFQTDAQGRRCRDVQIEAGHQGLETMNLQLSRCAVGTLVTDKSGFHKPVFVSDELLNHLKTFVADAAK